MSSDAIKQIAKQLQSPDVNNRRQAIIKLGKSKNPEAIKFLNWSVRNDEQEDLRKLASTGIKYIRESQSSSSSSAGAIIEEPKPISVSESAQPPVMAEPIHRRVVNNNMLIQDLVLLTAVFFLWLFHFQITADYFIRFDKVELADGSIVSDRVDMLKTLFSMYEYNNQPLVLRHIDSMHARLDVRDVRSLYSGSKTAASMIITSNFLYDVFLKDREIFPDEPMAEIGIGRYEGKEPLFSLLLNVATYAGIALAIVTIFPLLGVMPTRTAGLFQAISGLTMFFGMRVLWGVILLIAMFNLGVYIYFYNSGISQFLYDMLALLNMPATTIRVRDVLDGNFFFVFFLWGLIATVALASILFRPDEKLKIESA